MLVRKYIDFRAPLTEKQKADLARLEAMPDSEINFDDIPELTDEQLARMRRVNPVRNNPYRDDEPLAAGSPVV